MKKQFFLISILSLVLAMLLSSCSLLVPTSTKDTDTKTNTSTDTSTNTSANTSTESQIGSDFPSLDLSFDDEDVINNDYLIFELSEDGSYYTLVGIDTANLEEKQETASSNTSSGLLPPSAFLNNYVIIVPEIHNGKKVAYVDLDSLEKYILFDVFDLIVPIEIATNPSIEIIYRNPPSLSNYYDVYQNESNCIIRSLGMKITITDPVPPVIATDIIIK